METEFTSFGALHTVAHPATQSCIKQMLGGVNLELFNPLLAILGFHTPKVRLTFEDQQNAFIH